MTHVGVWFLEAGYCKHPEFTVIEGGSLDSIRFSSVVAVLEHPREGVVLFDTGYSPRFHEQTRRWPSRLYALLTPVTVHAEDTALHQLEQKGVSRSDVRTVVLSHFHADHAAGVADFPKARYVYQKTSYDAVRDLGSLASVRAGFLPGLLPPDFEARSRPVSSADLVQGAGGVPWRSGFDLFGDGSAVLVDLPGHVRGHSGLFVRATDGQTYFLVADACWLSRAYRERRMPHPVTSLIMDDRREYRATLDRLHDLGQQDPALRIIPCHCPDALQALPRWSARPASSRI